MQRILVAVDGSANARNALSVAIDMARSFDAELLICTSCQVALRALRRSPSSNPSSRLIRRAEPGMTVSWRRRRVWRDRHTHYHQKAKSSLPPAERLVKASSPGLRRWRVGKASDASIHSRRAAIPPERSSVPRKERRSMQWWWGAVASAN